MVDIKNNQALLEKEKLELLAEIKQIGVADCSDPGGFVAKEELVDHDDVPDSADVAAELEEIGRHHAILIELETRLEHVEEALEAIKKGTYGKCTECQADIPEKRMLVNPAATTCLEHGE